MCVSGTSAAQFSNYLDKLSDCGYTLDSEKAMPSSTGKSNLFSGYRKGMQYLWVYYLAETGEARIIEDRASTPVSEFEYTFDFDNNTITIRHTVTTCTIDGKHVQFAQDTTKTKSSMRTLPLVPVFKEKLLKLQEEQKEYRRVCGKCYDKRYTDYICVDEMGTLISPHYLTSAFPKLLEKNGLRRIRFHDLRHSCASLLLANGVPMKQIQEWLGHSDFSTTANVYAHLDYNSKLSSADAMVNGLKGALSAIN